MIDININSNNHLYFLGIAEAVSRGCTMLEKYGCVIVKNNRIISFAHADKFYSAEFKAILLANINDLKGSTLYLFASRKNKIIDAHVKASKLIKYVNIREVVTSFEKK